MTSESNALNPQLKHVDSAVPSARVRVGKTSAASTQLIGPKEKEATTVMMKNMATPARWAVMFVVPVPGETAGGKEAVSAARTANVQTKDADPYRSGFFRPTRSMKHVMKLWVRSGKLGVWRKSEQIMIERNGMYVH